MPTPTVIIPSIFTITNEIFLRAIFGPDWERVKVATCLGDPDQQPRDAWKGYPAVDMLRAAHAHLNTYFSVGVQTGTSRTLGEFEKICVIVLDDAGTKADLAKAETLLGTGPSYIIETSPNNYQAGWITEINSRDWALGLLSQLYQALDRKADNLKNAVGYMRLPIGVNGKAKCGPRGFRVRLTHWAPHIKITTLDWVAIETRIGKVVPLARRLTGPGAMPDPLDIEADVILQGFRLLGRVQGLGRPTTMGWGFDVDCPWIEDHTDRVQEGASYVPVKERFHCHHGHCQDKGMGEVRARLDELLREAFPLGTGYTLAGLEFDEVDPAQVPASPAGLAIAPDDTEDGLARTFAAGHENLLRYDHTRECWFRWTGGFWQPDKTKHALEWTRDLLRQQRLGAVDLKPSAIKALGLKKTIDAIERLARSDPRLAVDGEKNWDQDPWRVGAPGCEIDLKTGRIIPPDPTHEITKQLLVAPRDMLTPLWDQFLWDSTGGDVAVITFLQAWAGYGLTGDTAEEKFVFLYGPGGNGKSTFTHTISTILGDYAASTPAETFMQRKYEAHSEEVARLAGVRSVTASEIEGGRTFNLARLKDFTGGTQMSGRFMRQNTFHFMPQFKITFAGNHQPRLTVDAALRRRLILVPFTQRPTVANITLKDQLRAEYPGILQWMIEGENQRKAAGGLTALLPAVAAAATLDYLDDQDTIKAWAAERCVFGPAEQMGAQEAFDDYRTWCHARGEFTEAGIKDFRQQLVDKLPSCQQARTVQGSRVKGASLKPRED